jgi:hypothetical protein
VPQQILEKKYSIPYEKAHKMGTELIQLTGRVLFKFDAKREGYRLLDEPVVDIQDNFVVLSKDLIVRAHVAERRSNVEKR